MTHYLSSVPYVWLPPLLAGEFLVLQIPCEVPTFARKSLLSFFLPGYWQFSYFIKQIRRYLRKARKDRDKSWHNVIKYPATTLGCKSSHRNKDYSAATTAQSTEAQCSISYRDRQTHQGCLCGYCLNLRSYTITQVHLMLDSISSCLYSSCIMGLFWCLFILDKALKSDQRSYSNQT